MQGYEEFFRSAVDLLSVHQNGRQAYGRCPLHDDKIKSFSVNLLTSQWFCHSGCGAGNALTLSRRLGVASPDPSPPSPRGEGTAPTSSGLTRAKTAGGDGRVQPAVPLSRRHVATYEYYYEDGTAAFRVLRYEPKSFHQERWENGSWVPGTTGIRRVPYNLPKLLAATSTIFFVEGEKDADRLDSLGLVATTTPMGANSWKDEYAPHFRGKRVAVIPDNDEPGKAFAVQVAKGIAAAGGTVKLVSLPGIQEKGDVSNFLEINPNGKEALLSLVRSAPAFGIPPRSDETPIDYFKRFGLDLHDGKGFLPGEFRALCQETFNRFSNIAERCNELVQNKLDEADLVWKSCRTVGQYARFLRLLKEAHEASSMEHA